MSRRHAALNPRAHVTAPVTVDDVMASPRLSWPLKLHDCCPRSGGAAAIVISSDDVVPGLVELMRAFRAATGVGVLCNTSLNFRGAGLLNRASELFPFASERGIEHVVVDGAWCTHGR